jgi:hypothetical protein
MYRGGKGTRAILYQTWAVTDVEAEEMMQKIDGTNCKSVIFVVKGGY